MSAPAAGERLQALRRAKLRALVKARWPSVGDLDESGLPGGAAALGEDGRRGWVLVDDGSVSGLGAGMAWSRRRGAGALDVLVEDRPGGAVPSASAVIARRAGAFSEPPVVWKVDDTTLRPATPAPPDTGAGAGDIPAGRLDQLAREIVAHGADPVLEHGTLRAEVLGLEVARAVAGEGGEWELSVGVGHHDREARSELRPGESAGEALDDVVRLVRRWRTAGARRHPANTLARERWLRAVVISRPEIAGVEALTPIASPLPSGDLREAAPAAALGRSAGGEPVVVVCSTGVDLDLVPTAADIRLLHAPEARLVLVLPVADAYPVTRDLAAALAGPAEVRTVEEDWPALLA